jgi:hypothetical protein
MACTETTWNQVQVPPAADAGLLSHVCHTSAAVDRGLTCQHACLFRIAERRAIMARHSA